jgi:hypothetical protein
MMTGTTPPSEPSTRRVLSIGAVAHRPCAVEDFALAVEDELERLGIGVDRAWIDRAGRVAPGATLAALVRWPGRATASDLRPILHYTPGSFGRKGLPGPLVLLPLLLRRRHRRAVVFLHELAMPWGRHGWRGVVWGAWHRIALLALVSGADRVLVTTDHRKRWFEQRRWLPSRPVGLVPLVPTVSPTTAPDRAAGQAADTRWVVGTLSWARAAAVAGPVCARLGSIGRDRGIELHLLGAPGAGTGPARQWADAAAAAGLDLRFTGVHPAATISADLQALDLYLHLDPAGPAARKTSLLNAFAHGLPVVALDGPERDVGLTGSLALTDLTNLARDVGRLLDDPVARAELGQTAARYHQVHHAPESAAQALLDAVERPSGGGGRPPALAAPGPAEVVRRRVRDVGRLATAPARALPDFLVLGTQKGGTTSLFAYLADHPQVIAPTAKELHHFDYRYHRGSIWYRSRFPLRASLRHREGGGRTGEASPSYLFHPDVPGRVAADLPDARLVVLLRDPVERAHSHWRHQVRLGVEQLAFADAVEAEAERLSAPDADVGLFSPLREFSYVHRGRYGEQLARWIDAVGRERLLVLRSDDLFTRPGPTYAAVLRFLDLDEGHRPDFVVHNPGTGGGPVAAETDAYIRSLLAVDDRLLASLTGISFAATC